MELKLKYSAWFALACLLLIGAFSTAVYYQFRKTLLASAEQSLSSYMEHEWQHLTSHETDFGLELSNIATKSFHLRVLRNSHIVFDSLPKGNQSYEEEGEPRALLTRQFSRDLNGAHFDFLGVYDLKPTLRHVAALRNLLVLGCLLACLLIGPMGFAFTYSLLRPFRELSTQTSELSADKLAFRFATPSRLDEYGTLVRNFNSLLDRLQTSFHQVRRFAANASHELRTPLAIIQGETQLALRKPRRPEDYVATLSSIQAQTKILHKMIHHLLFLADLERVESVEVKTRIDVSEVIAETVHALRTVRPDSEVEIQVPTQATSVYLRSHHEIFASVINNLLENAMKYCHKIVRLTYDQSATHFNLLVEDDGPGIAPEDREAVLELFHRPPASLASKKNSSHGLGLSIVKACVGAAHGTLSLSESALGGLRVQVSLPIES